MMHLYSAGQARPLATRLAEVLGDPPPDPMTPEWLAVPSDGMRRWLSLELARHLGASGEDRGDGIAANIQRAYPGTLRNCVLTAGRGDPEADPWSIERLVWSVLGVAEDRPADPDLALFLALPDGASRYAKARRVADLFDRYHLHRPGMIRAWSAGRFVDGTGRRLADHAAWQPRLWQLVRDRVGEASPPERLAGLLDGVRSGELTLDLPDRLLLFGFTLLPGGAFLDVARAIAARRDVHLFLLEPSHLDADRLLESSPLPANGTPRLRSNDLTAELVNEPLLRSWGRLHRETSLLLADAEAEGLPERQPIAPFEEAVPGTVLGRLQHGIRTNTPPAPVLEFGPRDRSVQFHACYGPTRQVEVLRDVLLHLLDEPDAHLTEDDILVVCPTLDRFAPLIEAVFGPSVNPPGQPPLSAGSTGKRQGAPGLRYRIADQSIRTANPVLSATAALLALVAGRFEVVPVLDFLALGPVRQRLGFTDEDLSAVADWVTATNVRWGLDPEHRAPFGVPATIVTNTWRAALDRLLVGSAVYDDDLTLAIGDVAPYGVEGSGMETVGRLAEAMWILGDLVADAERPRPIAEWVGRLLLACDSLFATDRDSDWQMDALRQALEDVIESATTDGVVSSVLLEFVDIRRLFDEHLDGTPGRPNFFRGGITVSSMTPLRWVPFRVVCVLGMDQSAFGSTAAVGEDLAAAVPQIGDRDPRAEVRQSLLETVLAAGDYLVVVRDGYDLRSNQTIPRAVVAAELFDAVSALVGPSQRVEFEAALEVDHPRHAFDEPCFEADALVKGMVWGFDRANLQGALARRERTHHNKPLLVAPLAPNDAPVIELADLHRFFKDPVEAFFTQRLEARLPWSEERPHSRLPVELDPLEAWQVGSRMLEARLSGMGLEEWSRVERVRGTLPPGRLEGTFLAELNSVVDELVATADRCGVRREPAELFEIDVKIADGTRIVGSVPLGLHPATPGPARVTYSRMKAPQRLGAWLDLMALAASDPSGAWRSVAIGRHSESKVKAAEVVDLVVSTAVSTGTTSAVAALAVAVDCYRRGMREPIPLFANFSFAVSRNEAVRSRWTGYHGRGDGDDRSVALAFGRCDFEEIMELPAQPHDPIGTGRRVERFAHYLWGTVAATSGSYPPVPAGSPSGGAGPTSEGPR
jgi:exodeoxyribonuclease V gamma subunit